MTADWCRIRTIPCICSEELKNLVVYVPGTQGIAGGEKLNASRRFPKASHLDFLIYPSYLFSSCSRSATLRVLITSSLLSQPRRAWKIP